MIASLVSLLLAVGSSVTPEDLALTRLRARVPELVHRLSAAEARSWGAQRDLLKTVLGRQLALRKDVRALREAVLTDFVAKTPALGEVGPVAMAKGEERTIKHTIRWRMYEKDDLKVKVTVSDASLKGPDELKLEFDRDFAGFRYKLRAGQKTGEFTVTLTPEVGPPSRFE